MHRFAGGYLCLSLTPADCDRLGLHPQTPVNTSVRGTPFTVSIDAAPQHGVTTGISAQDRAATIRLAIDPATEPDDFVRPGHINPLRSREGGVLVRIGQTEGAVDLARLAGLHPSALLIEMVKDDGTMARRDDLEHLCAQHDMKMCSVEQLIQYRLGRERLVSRLEPAAGTRVTTPHGDFTLYAYESAVDPLPHVVLTCGGVGAYDAQGHPQPNDEPTLVRMHRREVLGDIFGIQGGGTPSGRDTLDASMKAVQQAGRGAIVYLRPQGAGDELTQRLVTTRAGIRFEDEPDLRARAQAGGQMPANMRAYGIGGQILRDLGLRRLRLLTNRPRDLKGLDAFGLEIVEHVSLELE